MSVSVNSIAQVIERLAPKAWAEDWDNVGLLVGDGAAQVERVLICLDGTADVVEEARQLGAQMIIAHHPIIFRPLKNLRADNQAAAVPLRLINEKIAYYAAHTNLDQSTLSASWSLAQALRLEKTEFFSPTASENLFKLAVFVPAPEVEKVRQALVKVGVGEGITDGPHSAFYAECFFQAEGTGMFRPLAGANPAIGELGELTRVKEIKLESIMPERLIDKAVRAMRQAHPYEEPAYDIIPLRNEGKPRGYGVIGYLDQPENLAALYRRITAALQTLNKPWAAELNGLSQLAGIRYTGEPNKQIRKIAIVNGSGGSFIPKALFKGVDLFISGDIDHHGALDALESGMAIADIGHFWSEAPMLESLRDYLSKEKALKGIEFHLSSTNRTPWNENI